MQIDAPINRGNSGGPTFDVYGRVVGVNTAIYSPSGGSVGIGFAVPADVAAEVAKQLRSGKTIRRAYIGASVATLSPEEARRRRLDAPGGVLVAALTPSGPAARAGLPMASPFLDDRVIEACLSVEPGERVTPWRYKPVLGAAMRGIVPEDCLRRADKAAASMDAANGLRDEAFQALAEEKGVAAHAAEAAVVPVAAAPAAADPSTAEVVRPDPAVLTRTAADAASTPTIGSGRLEFEAWTVVPVGEVSVLDDLPKKAAKEKVRAVATEIVEFEGPIHLDRLAQPVHHQHRLGGRCVEFFKPYVRLLRPACSAPHGPQGDGPQGRSEK